MSTLAERIRKHRQYLGMDQGQLAELCGMTRRSISGFETGGKQPSSKSLKRLAAALEVSTAYLLGKTEDPVEGIADELTAPVAEIIYKQKTEAELTELLLRIEKVFSSPIYTEEQKKEFFESIRNLYKNRLK